MGAYRLADAMVGALVACGAVDGPFLRLPARRLAPAAGPLCGLRHSSPAMQEEIARAGPERLCRCVPGTPRHGVESVLRSPWPNQVQGRATTGVESHLAKDLNWAHVGAVVTVRRARRASSVECRRKGCTPGSPHDDIWPDSSQVLWRWRCRPCHPSVQKDQHSQRKKSGDR